MGFLKMLLNVNTAEATRESMRMSYKKHQKRAARGMIPDDGTTPHQFGLFGALYTRYMTAGISKDAAEIWVELSPFLLMEEPDGLEALCEYVVYQERPSEAKTSWLKYAVSESLRKPAISEESPRHLASRAMLCKVCWFFELVDDDVRRALEHETAKDLLFGPHMEYPEDC
jgi:hypothetical protein